MTSRIRRLGVLLLVLGLVAQSAVAPAMAASTTPDDDGAFGDECGRTFTQLTVDVLTGNFDESSKCEAKELVANASRPSIYASALAQDDLASAGITPITNHVEDSKTFARTIVKSESVKAFNNGTSKAQIKAQVNDSVEDYYTNMQLNLAENYQSHATQLYYIHNVSESTGDDYFRGIIKEYGNTTPTFDFNVQNLGGTNQWWDEDSGVNAPNEAYVLTQQNVTLLNGEEINMTTFTYKDTDDNRVGFADPFNVSSYQGPDGNQEYQQIWMAMYVGAPDADLKNSNDNYDSSELNKSNSVEAFDEKQYYQANEDIKQTSHDVKVEAEKYIDGLFATYNQSEGIPVDEVLDPLTLTAQWNTDYESTGYNGWIAAELGLTGLEGNVDSSFDIAYTPRANHTPTRFALNGSETEYAFVDGVESNMSGTLYTDWKPSSTNGTFQTGATYDTANADTAVLFIEQVDENSSRVVTLNGTFSITSLTNVQNNTEINSTTLDEQNFQTWNASSTKEEIEYLTEYRSKVIENYEVTGGVSSPNLDTSTGGFFDDLASFLETLLSGTLIGLLALIVIGLWMFSQLTG
jgi:hypothetical protein